MDQRTTENHSTTISPIGRIGVESNRTSSAVAPFLSKDCILEAVEAVFAESGYDGTTIRAIAGRLNCSVGSIYRYFQDKRDLLRACAGRVFSPVSRYLEAGAINFDESLAMYLQLVDQYPQLYRLMFWLESVDGGAARTPQPIQRMIEGWTRHIGHRAGAEQTWAIAHGLIMLGNDPQLIERRIISMARPTHEADPSPAMTTESHIAEPIEPTVYVVPDREDVTLL